MEIAVTGARGMVAQRLLPRLEAGGARVRQLGRADTSELVGRADLARRLAGAHAIVHLAGTFLARSRAAFREAHLETTRRLVAAGEDAGVERFLLLSLPGADPLSSNAYLSSKGRAEAAVYQSALAPTVFRVGPVLGPGRPVSDLAVMARAGRFLLPGGGRARVRPIAVGDLAELLARALLEGRARGQALEAGGPDVCPWAGIAGAVAAALRVRARVIGVPGAVAGLMARWEVMRHRAPAFTPESVALLLVDVVPSTRAVAAALFAPPTPMEEAVRLAVQGLEGRP